MYCQLNPKFAGNVGKSKDVKNSILGIMHMRRVWRGGFANGVKRLSLSPSNLGRGCTPGFKGDVKCVYENQIEANGPIRVLFYKTL